MNSFLNQLLNMKSLSRDESFAMFSNLHTYPLEQQAAILTALRVKKESAEEILGALDFFKTQFNVFSSPFDDVIDIVGTGGDGIGTFNISTATSLLAARCGVRVAKNGGRAVSSRTGSMDVIAALGLKTSNSEQSVIDSLAQNQYAFIEAAEFNHGFNAFSGLRKTLGFPTLFNILGPLLHPMQPKRMLMGVYRLDLVNKIAQVLRHQGVQHALVVHAADGLDELSVSAPNYVAEIRDDMLSEYMIEGQDLGLPSANLQDVTGGDAIENSRIIQGILSGEIDGAQSDMVVLNTAAALYVAGRVVKLEDGIVLAKQALGVI